MRQEKEILSGSFLFFKKINIHKNNIEDKISKNRYYSYKSKILGFQKVEFFMKALPKVVIITFEISFRISTQKKGG